MNPKRVVTEVYGILDQNNETIDANGVPLLFVSCFEAKDFHAALVNPAHYRVEELYLIRPSEKLRLKVEESEE